MCAPQCRASRCFPVIPGDGPPRHRDLRARACRTWSITGPFTRPQAWTTTAVSGEPTDVEAAQLTIAPGGTSGWHAHPAPVFVIVTAGELTVYDEEEIPCKPTVYPAGTGFVETAGSVHAARNDGSVTAALVATSLAPLGVATPSDAPQANAPDTLLAVPPRGCEDHQSPARRTSRDFCRFT